MYTDISNLNNLNERNVEFCANLNLNESYNIPALSFIPGGNTTSPISCLSFGRITDNQSSVSVVQMDSEVDHQQHSQSTNQLKQNSLQSRTGTENHQPSIFGAEVVSSSNGTNNIPISTDEISKSLVKFAFWTAYENNNEIESSSLNAVDDVMQDFASNGYVSDEINGHCSFTRIANINNINNGATNSSNLSNCTNYCTKNSIELCQLNSQLHPTLQHQLNVSINNDKVHVLNILPTNAQYTQQWKSKNTYILPTIAPATKSDQTCTQKRQSKRNNSAKNENHTTVKHCVFCENNNEPEAVVKSHAVRDSMGRVLCPRLRVYICPICKASGDMAHTVKYCPQKPIVTMEDSIRFELFRLAKINCYKQQMRV